MIFPLSSPDTLNRKSVTSAIMHGPLCLKTILLTSDLCPRILHLMSSFLPAIVLKFASQLVGNLRFGSTHVAIASPKRKQMFRSQLEGALPLWLRQPFLLLFPVLARCLVPSVDKKRVFKQVAYIYDMRLSLLGYSKRGSLTLSARLLQTQSIRI